MLESLFNKVAGLRPATLLKRDLFSCDYCEAFKNSFSYRIPLVTTSGRKNSETTSKASDPKSKASPSKRLSSSPTRKAEIPTLPNLSAIGRKPIDPNKTGGKGNN